MRLSTLLAAPLLAAPATAAIWPPLLALQDYLECLRAKAQGTCSNNPYLSCYCPAQHDTEPVPPPTSPGDFITWKSFKANGVNLGGWLEKEKALDPMWWDSVGGSTVSDEWSLCQKLGRNCGPILEARYETFLNTSIIDKLASVGVNTLRIPTTYAAWVRVPGSELYTGNQKRWLQWLTSYAIEEYGMHIILSLHSLPGGVNSLGIGEALGKDDWFYNTQNLAYSFEAIDALLDFIQASDHLGSWTIAPINEASDNPSRFGTPAGLSDKAAAYVNKYIKGCLSRIAKVDKRIPLMLQDSYKGSQYWDRFYAASTNLVIDSHVYYFKGSALSSADPKPAVCAQGRKIAQAKKFPVFIGEWSLQKSSANTLGGRESFFDTQRYAWQTYTAGSAFWTGVSFATAAVQGEGAQRDYGSYVDLIEAGVIKSPTETKYC